MAQPTLSYSKPIPIRHAVNVVVVGGGPAGVAASVAAGRFGASVMLVEQTGTLGGMGTSGLVPGFCQMGDGKRIVVGGIGQEVVERLGKTDGLGPDVNPKALSGGIAFQVEKLKLLYDQMVTESGVLLRLMTSLVDVVTDGRRVRAVVLGGREGLYAVQAQCFVDATGDGLLSYLAGAKCELGDAKGDLMPPTPCSIFAGVDYKAFYEFRRKAHPRNAVQETVERAIEEGFFSTPDRHHPGAWRTGQHLAGMNVGHVHGTNAVDDAQLTKALLEGRRVVQENLAFYRKYIPGFEQAELATTGSLLGVRETRRVVADYMLTAEDFVAWRSFGDQIGRYCYPIDIHPSKATDKDYEAFLKEFKQQYCYKSGESYGIPLRSLIVRDVDNLMVAGRCMGTDRKMQGSTRVMPCCFITGQAAGVTAGMAVERDGAARKVESGLVVERLRKDGAYIPKPTASA
ncbi:MAG: FAD-dependent oxidoreductase [Phycisphaerae bacterium]|nr:FAD-dependent oxidoreductase [Phycisphaerae bacterium]